MSDDASQRSLDGQVSELRAIVEDLAARAERQDRIDQILASASAPPPPRRRAPRHKRDRHGLRVIPGGLAALAPVLAFHESGVPAVGAAAVRWLFGGGHDRARYVVAAVVLGLAGAWTAPTSITAAGPPPAHALLVPGHDHDPPPARPLHHP